MPDAGRYDVIWSQWVLGHLNDGTAAGLDTASVERGGGGDAFRANVYGRAVAGDPGP